MNKKLCNFVRNKRIYLIEITTIIASLIIFLYFLTSGINLPYVGPNATNFNVYSLIAHNFNKFGYLETKLAPVISVSNVLPQKPEYFFHHPTLLSFVESVLFRMFGESFWVGRVTVIIFAIGTFILTFFIGKKLVNKKYGVVAIFVTAIIPASTLFGKMIGQEPLVLFFSLLALYSVLMYLSSENKKFLILRLIAVILGVLSDWPMMYFIFFFIPLFAKYKKTKTGIYLVLFSFAISAIFLVYVYFLRSGFWDLQNAVTLRSITGLLPIPLWPIRWIVTIFLRFVIYFNPILFLLSTVTLYEIYKRYIKKQLSDVDLVIVGLFLFGIFHVFLYSQASFTHPYLIYYLVPFIAYGSSLIILKFFLEKSYFYFGGLTFLSIIYLLVIQIYKNEQISSNLWRYELTRKVSQHVSLYEEVLLNPSSVIDSDLLWYPFLINRKIMGENTSIENNDKHNHYIYSCLGKCNPQNIRLNVLKHRYSFVYIVDSHAETYIFLLKQKKNYKTEEKQLPIREINLSKYSTQTEGSRLIRQIYRFIVEILKVPQI